MNPIKAIRVGVGLKIEKECGRFGQIDFLLKALKSCPKSNKSANLVTLVIIITVLTYFQP